MITRKVDALGRIIIPRELRKEYAIEYDITIIDIIPTHEGLLLKKHIGTCMICGETENLIEIENKYICKTCISKLYKCCQNNECDLH